MKDVRSFEGLYAITEQGKVWSYAKAHQKIHGGQWLIGRVHKFGYVNVILCKKGTYKQCRVHRLVADAFIPNPYGLPVVNHKNGIKADNRVENLEWCTHSDNRKHSHRTGLSPRPKGVKNVSPCVF